MSSSNLKKPTFWHERRAAGRGYGLIIGVDEVGRGAFAGPVVAGAVAVWSRGLPGRPSLNRLGLNRFATPARLRNPSPRHPHFNEEVNWETLGIDDSKRLTAGEREKLAKIIKKYAVWGIGEVGVTTINRIGIVKATEKAMRAAIAALCKKKDKIQDTRFKIQERKRDAGSRKREKDSISDFQSLVSNPESCIWDPVSGPKSFVLIDAFHVKYIPGVGLGNQKGIIKGDQKVLSIAAASIIAKVYRDKLMYKFYKNYKNYKWGRNKGYGTADHIEAIKKHGLTRLHRLAFVKNII